MKNVLLFITLYWTGFTASSQSITAQVFDNTNHTPISYATIKTGENSGVISNEEGFFTIYNMTNSDSIMVSCLGFKTKTLHIKELKSLNFIIKLDEAVNQLSEIYISNKTLTAQSIIDHVQKNLNQNYNTKLNEYHIFSRTTNYSDFKNLDFKIEKASHVKKKNLEAANNELEGLSKKVKESHVVQFEDFKGELFCLNRDSSKLKITKATKIFNHTNDFSIDDIQEKAQNIILKYLDSTQTYKLKTGMFKLEDSLAFNDEKFKEFQQNEYQLKVLNTNTKNALLRSQFYKDSFLSNFLDEELYKYTLINTTFNNDILTYTIKFTPQKSSAKYTGLMSIDGDSFAITRINYSFFEDRQGKKINLKLLLGVKYIHNISQGIVLFEKNNTKVYHPKYLKHTFGSYFYANRDIKFIKNSNTKDKISFNFKLEGDNRYKQEILFTANTKLTLSDFENIKQDSVVVYKKLKTFEKSLWENEEILEPLEEMKVFNKN